MCLILRLHGTSGDTWPHFKPGCFAQPPPLSNSVSYAAAAHGLLPGPKWFSAIDQRQFQGVRIVSALEERLQAVFYRRY